MSGDEFEAWIRENQAAAACGSCLLLVARLRRQASRDGRRSAVRVTPTAHANITAGQVGPVGIEPTTRGLKVRCSAS